MSISYLRLFILSSATIASSSNSIFATEWRTESEQPAVAITSTFHCLSLYWSPPQGGPDRTVALRYREPGQQRWSDGLPLRYHPVSTDQCQADYRGSLVNLRPGTTYEIELTLEGTEARAVTTGTTWGESFPVAETIKVGSRTKTFVADQSGSLDGYLLYDGTGSTIDTGNQEDVGIAVRGSYVILRGFTIKNVKQHGIRLFEGHHIIIEDCDISKWGSEDEKGWGKNYQAAVFSNQRDLRSVVIQRCKMHHPSWGSNSWAEKHGQSNHPAGPQAVVFWESEGNHVFRYNECWSDIDHYFNDVLGAGYNGSYRGFPGADSDIYCNYIANCWDDGIEAEGGNQNVRIWNNYVEDSLIPLANAATSVGPLYIWRNVSGRSHSPAGSSWNMTHGPFMKMGYANGEHWMTGHMYVFNNTIFQPNDQGAAGLGGSGRIIKHCMTRNNILHLRRDDRYSIAVSDKHEDNDFDYDLCAGRYPAGHEQHGVTGAPTYVAGAGFDRAAMSGVFQLATGSDGLNAGVVIPNFCEPLDANPPDMGAHENSAPPMRFGVNARFTPPCSVPQSKPTADDVVD